MSASKVLPPALQGQRQKDSSSDNALWIRLAAFFSLRSANTQITYKGILSEWCEFLGAEPGSSVAAQRVLAATDLHAIAYRNWLEGRPGQKPRMQRSSPDNPLKDD